MAKEPASIRFRNPGAMWGSALAIKWGANPKPVSLKDGTGQNNNIAVFPAYVQGICAQLDLWRTSKHYRNKKFSDAIAIWSGHNSVESYIAFVLKRVPGMTRNTVLNDEFWKSPKGIAFLKAQAWHEAGKKYPAPDNDWIEAQQIVFAKAPPVAKALPVIDPLPASEAKVKNDPKVWDIQERLNAMNYNPGTVDGLWGGRTGGVITAFINDRGLKIAAPTNYAMFAKVYDALVDELTKAESEGFARPIAVERSEATEATVAEKAPEIVPVKRSRLAALWATITSIVLGVVNALADYFQDALSWVVGLKQYAADAPAYLWFIIAAGVALVIWFAAKNGANGIVEAFRKGDRA